MTIFPSVYRDCGSIETKGILSLHTFKDKDEPSTFSDPFNYSVIGRSVDEFVVMLYNEFGWPGSPPGPAVTIGWMNRVLQYTMTKMPKNKIVAVSVFGFDFNLTTGRSTYVTYQSAVNLAQGTTTNNLQ